MKHRIIPFLSVLLLVSLLLAGCGKEPAVTGLSDEEFHQYFAEDYARPVSNITEIVEENGGLSLKTDVAPIAAMKAGTVVYAADYGVWLTDIGRAVCTGGESLKEVYGRVSAALCDIVGENKGKTVLLTYHGAAIRAMTAFLSGLPVEKMKEVDWVSNASVTVVFHGADGFRIETLGYDAHLGDLRSRLPKNV